MANYFNSYNSMELAVAFTRKNRQCKSHMGRLDERVDRARYMGELQCLSHRERVHDA